MSGTTLTLHALDLLLSPTTPSFWTAFVLSAVVEQKQMFFGAPYHACQRLSHWALIGKPTKVHPCVLAKLSASVLFLLLLLVVVAAFILAKLEVLLWAKYDTLLPCAEAQ